MRASLSSLGRRLPELTADLAHLADLLDQNAPDALEKTRAVVAKMIRAICADEEIELEADASIEDMLGLLVEKQVLPFTIAAQVRAIQDPQNTLIGDAARSLVGFLEWRVGSRSHIKYIPPAKRSRKLIVAVLIGAIAITGITIAILAWPSAPPELASGEMVRIAGAKLEMGSKADEMKAALALCRDVEHRTDCEVENEQLAQEQLRTVVIASFELDRHEVTVAEYVAWLNREPPPPNSIVVQPNVNYDPATHQFSVKPEHAAMPIVGVSWPNANAYCAAVRKRLPTEAEWELAARGVERRTFPWGDDRPTCTEVVYARREHRPCFQVGSWPEDAGPVMTATKDITPETVRDLGGNVSEWTADAGGNRPRCSGPCENPRIDGPATTRVIRGGNWAGWMGWTRAAARRAVEPETTRTNIGFRCAR